jgi:hypothetical protein
MGGLIRKLLVNVLFMHQGIIGHQTQGTHPIGVVLLKLGHTALKHGGQLHLKKHRYIGVLAYQAVFFPGQQRKTLIHGFS